MTTAFSLFSHTEANKVGGSGKVEHIAVRVKGYDLESQPQVVIGTRLDNGEEVRIALDQKRIAERHKSTSHQPPKIELFAGQGRGNLAKRSVDVDGVILFSAVMEQNGGLYAGWASALSHGPKEGTNSVIVATANLASWIKDNESKGYVNILLTDPNYVENLVPHVKDRLSMKGKPFIPMLYKDLESVRKYAEILFSKGLGVVIRVRLINAEAEGTYNVIQVDTMRTFGDNLPTPTEWYDQRVSKNIETDVVRKMLASGEIDIEVIPVLGVPLSANIKSEFDTPRWKSLREKYNTLTSKGVQRLFMPSIITLYQHPDSPALVLSAITPQLMSDAYVGMDGAGFYVETEHGKGSDEGVRAAQLNPDDFKVKYVRKERTAPQVNNHAGSTLEQSTQLGQNQNGLSNGGVQIDNFDDDIPF